MSFFSETRIMGILNLTPDSFSDGGCYTHLSAALQHASEMLSFGAHLVDIGGESSRPGSKPLPVSEERNRVMPVIQALIKQIPGVFLSVDTYKPEIADEALSLGARMVNDIRGLSEPVMAKTVARHGAFAVIMHMQGHPETMQNRPMTGDAVLQVLEFFKERVDFALSAGIPRSKMILDPGIGFGKTPEDNLALIKASGFFEKTLGFPVLIGASRKSVIGHILSNSVSERKNGSVTLHTLALLSGAKIIRVHDVKESAEALQILKAFYPQRGF